MERLTPSRSAPGCSSCPPHAPLEGLQLCGFGYDSLMQVSREAPPLQLHLSPWPLATSPCISQGHLQLTSPKWNSTSLLKPVLPAPMLPLCDWLPMSVVILGSILGQPLDLPTPHLTPL